MFGQKRYFPCDLCKNKFGAPKLAFYKQTQLFLVYYIKYVLFFIKLCRHVEDQTIYYVKRTFGFLRILNMFHEFTV